MIGTKLGPYEILAPLGAGGMGEVYRARDARLGRDVALKVLPEVFSKDAERMARFEREAQVLASLNHPNIATLYGLEEAGGVRALAMELVEGETLRGPIPLEEALPIAKQIAEALEYAHEKGIVHRDLKPSNVKITPEGKVKVLDFGLAKALEDDAAATSISNSPTISLAATRAGVILGTAAYMSPEQAKGKSVDRRADIWAFGVVLYEMLTGKQLYAGDTVAETLAFVMTKDPGLDALPAATPPAIRNLLRRCLQRDSRQRLQAIGEARIAIEEAPQELVGPLPHGRGSALPWIVTAAIAVLIAAAVSWVHFGATPAPERTVRFSIPAPEKTSVQSFAISPDGRLLAMSAATGGRFQLWLRPLDALQAQPLPGTDEATWPFWSPDSRYIGFFAQGKLKKIAASGGPAQTLCDAPNGRGATWGRDGVIVFALFGFRGGLQRVAAAGGAPVAATKVDRFEIKQFPVFLPDGRHFLYVSSAGGAEGSGVYWALLDSPAGRRVLADVSSAAYVPPEPGSRTGHLLFVREDTLMALPFDPKALQPAGEGFPAAEQVSLGAISAYAPVSVSDTGTIVYQSGRGLGESQLTWYDRGGRALSKVGAPDLFGYFALSLDEKSVAKIHSTGGGTRDVWLHEVARGAETRFTHDASRHYSPVWSPDGGRLVFTSDRGGRPDLYVKEASGSGEDKLLLQTGEPMFATDWSRDGRFILYSQIGAKTRYDLWVLPLDGDRKPVLFLQTEFMEMQAQFSPNGHWIAYTSDESGRNEVYVRPFPTGSGKSKISIDGGHFPRWRRDGKELFYLSPDRKLMAVAVMAEVSGARPVFEVAGPEGLFEIRIPTTFAGYSNFPYVVGADGKRFLVSMAGAEAAEAPLTVVLNWQAGVKK